MGGSQRCHGIAADGNGAPQSQKGIIINHGRWHCTGRIRMCDKKQETLGPAGTPLYYRGHAVNFSLDQLQLETTANRDTTMQQSDHFILSK